MQSPSFESDPAIDAARASEQDISRRFETENNKRAEISGIVAQEKVPTYDQLVSAQEWVDNVRNTATFDSDGKLVQEVGLSDLYEGDIDKIADYFETDRWELTPRELTLAKSITDTYHGNKLDKLKLLAGVSPRFGTELSKDLKGVSKTDMYDRIQTMADDTASMIKLSLAIRKSRDPSIGPNKETDKATDAGLFNLNVDRAVHELQKPKGPIDESTRSDEESASGLTFVQKNTLLEHHKHKQKPHQYSEIKSKFNAEEADRSGPISEGLRKVGINKLPSRGGTRREKVRRFINGTETKPAVASRHKLETTIKLASERLEDKDLSPREKERLQKRREKAEGKIRRGSRINPNKYGAAASRKGAERDSNTYDPAQLLDAAKKTKAERDSIEDGNFARQVHAALKREASNPEIAADNIDLQLNDQSFNEVLDAIGKKFDQLLESRHSQIQPGERVKNHQIDEMYVESQLLVAKEIAEAYFSARNIKLSPVLQSRYVRQLLEAFHAYEPKTPDTKQARSNNPRPSPAAMPKKKPQARSNPSMPQSYEDVLKFAPNA